MSEAKISGQYYREAGVFITKEQSRYALDVIRIEPHPKGGTVIIATDGHTMGVFHDIVGKCDVPVSVRYKEVIAAAILEHKGCDLDIIDGRLEIVKRGDVLVTFHDVTKDANTFPNWQAVLPSSDDCSRYYFNPEFLARCALNEGGFSRVALSLSPDNTKQTIVRTERDDFCAIVMPMKGEGVPKHAYPEFMESLVPSAESREIQEAATASALSQTTG